MYMKSADSYILAILNEKKKSIKAHYTTKRQLRHSICNVEDEFPGVNDVKLKNCRNYSKNCNQNDSFPLISMHQKDHQRSDHKKHEIRAGVVRVGHASVFESEPVVNHQKISPPSSLAQFCLEINHFPLRSASEQRENESGEDYQSGHRRHDSEVSAGDFFENVDPLPSLKSSVERIRKQQTAQH